MQIARGLHNSHKETGTPNHTYFYQNHNTMKNEHTNIDQSTQRLLQVEEQLTQLNERIEKYKKQKKQLLHTIRREMEHEHLEKLETDKFSIIYVHPTQIITFNGRKFKEDNPTLYMRYTKTIPRQAHVKMTLK